MIYIVIERIFLLFTIATNISISFIYFSVFLCLLLLLSNEMTVIVYWTRIKLATERISGLRVWVVFSLPLIFYHSQWSNLYIENHFIEFSNPFGKITHTTRVCCHCEPTSSHTSSSIWKCCSIFESIKTSAAHQDFIVIQLTVIGYAFNPT